MTLASVLQCKVNQSQPIKLPDQVHIVINFVPKPENIQIIKIFVKMLPFKLQKTNVSYRPSTVFTYSIYKTNVEQSIVM